jgi:hypothetical protein
MISYGRPKTWAVALALGLSGLAGLGAANVHASGTAASAFELTLEATLAPPFYLSPVGGTFRSGAPFCARGTFVEPDERVLRFTCDDGTGGWTVDFDREVELGRQGLWRIRDGSGSYADLRGRGSMRGEQVCVPCDLEKPIPWRGTLQGFVDRDAVAPTIAFTRATATKLPRPKGAYVLRVGVALRDDVADNPVSYTVRVCAYTVYACDGVVELARRVGTTSAKAVSMTLRIRHPGGTRTVHLRLTGEDPVGNAVSLRRTVVLGR